MPFDRALELRMDMGALRHNFQVAKDLCAQAKIWSVVKANAYGHGLERCVTALQDISDGFALVELERAIALREAGIHSPLLILKGYFSLSGVRACVRHRLTPVIHCQEQLAMLKEGLATGPVPALYIKVNTGLNRLGFEPESVEAVRDAVNAIAPKIPIVWMTHFANSDDARGVAWQLARLPAFIGKLSNNELSVANSAALLRFRETRSGFVRPGIMLYGSSPFPFADTRNSARALNLQPVMHFSTRVIAVRILKAGERIGYGGIFTATQPMKVAVVACGYADGYPRHAPAGTPIVVAGVRATLVGRVAMDMITVDVSHIAHVGMDTPVELWGAALPADEVAAAIGTTSYELFCAVNPALRATII